MKQTCSCNQQKQLQIQDIGMEEHSIKICSWFKAMFASPDRNLLGVFKKFSCCITLAHKQCYAFMWPSNQLLAFLPVPLMSKFSILHSQMLLMKTLISPRQRVSRRCSHHSIFTSVQKPYRVRLHAFLCSEVARSSCCSKTASSATGDQTRQISSVGSDFIDSESICKLPSRSLN